MRIFVAAVALSVALISAATRFPEAPTGFDNKTNGIVDDLTHQADQVKFEGVEQLSDGLGPLYNAQSCAECHGSPVSGASSQVTELRIGHRGPDGRFRTPDIPIAHGAEVVTAALWLTIEPFARTGRFPTRKFRSVFQRSKRSAHSASR
jgi:hypothetical protein